MHTRHLLLVTLRRTKNGRTSKEMGKRRAGTEIKTQKTTIGLCTARKPISHVHDNVVIYFLYYYYIIVLIYKYYYVLL